MNLGIIMMNFFSTFSFKTNWIEKAYTVENGWSYLL